MQIESSVQSSNFIQGHNVHHGNQCNGPQTIWVFEEPLPVFSELMVDRLDNCSEIFTHWPLLP